MDVRTEGFPLRAIPVELAPSYDGRVGLETFGHHWYSDRAATRFIRAMDSDCQGRCSRSPVITGRGDS